MNRKSALERLDGLRLQVEAHMKKLRDHSTSADVPHWRSEIESRIQQMEETLPVLGRKTSRE